MFIIVVSCNRIDLSSFSSFILVNPVQIRDGLFLIKNIASNNGHRPDKSQRQLEEAEPGRDLYHRSNRGCSIIICPGLFKWVQSLSNCI